MAEALEPTLIVKSHCNKCKGERNHAVLAKHRTTWEELVEGRFSIDGGDAYEFLKCCGCDAVHLRHKSWFSEDRDEDGRPAVETRYYPPKLDRHEPRWIREHDWVFLFDTPVKGLLDEVYRALASDAKRLAVMGIRALLEAAMIEKAVDTGSFKGNLDALKRKGLVSDHQLLQMGEVIEVGHAAIHRGFNPSHEELLASLDVAEDIIEALYITPERAKKLTSRIPPRTRALNPPSDEPEAPPAA